MRSDRYFCEWPECGRSYSKPSKLSEHFRSHTNDRCFVCECGKSFLRNGHLQRHQLTAHLGQRPFVCSFEGCTAAFALKHHLMRHEKLHSNPKPFSCNWEGCELSFSKHDLLRKHICLEHTGEAVFRCESCKLNFTDKASFKRHEKTAHSERVYMCGVEGCGLTFSKWSQVVTHRRSEHSKKSDENAGEEEKEELSFTCNIFTCEECGKGPFKSESSLKQHEKTHITPRPALKFGCGQCEKEFSSRSNLKAHVVAVHSESAPFKCEFCDKSYGYKKLLKRHVERNHNTEEIADCDDINIHEGHDHNDDFQSVPTPPPSDEHILDLDDMTASAYFTERNLTCPVEDCRRRFFRKYDLDRHIRAIHSTSTLDYFIE